VLGTRALRAFTGGELETGLVTELGDAAALVRGEANKRAGIFRKTKHGGEVAVTQVEEKAGESRKAPSTNHVGNLLAGTVKDERVIYLLSSPGRTGKRKRTGERARRVRDGGQEVQETESGSRKKGGKTKGDSRYRKARLPPSLTPRETSRTEKPGSRRHECTLCGKKGKTKEASGGGRMPRGLYLQIGYG